MKKVLIKSIFFAVFFLAFAPFAKAAPVVYFSIQYESHIVANRVFTLPDAGTKNLIDDAGVSHAVDAQSVLAVLSNLQDATSAFKISDLRYYSAWNSLYLLCMNIPQNSSACNNWQYMVGSTYPDVGMDAYKLAGGETVYVYFGNFGDLPIQEDQNAFQFFSSGATGSGPSISAAQTPPPLVSQKEFDAQKAVQFLRKFQQSNGSFGNAPLLNDWAAIAFGAYKEANPAKEKLAQYLLTNPDPGGLLTDYERRAMALEALGINPYSGTGINYIQKILGKFDGTQFGDPQLLNDDIFAILSLIPAGYRNNDKEMQADISFLLKNQKSDGSFGGNVDLTAAAVQALSEVSATSDVQDALAKAGAFLKARQGDSGGFGNVYSTSWAMQAIASLGENANSWVKNNHTPGEYLQFQQASDGGVQEGNTDTNRVWATSYAIPAALGKDWGSLVLYVGKPLHDIQTAELAVVAPPAVAVSKRSANGDLQAIEKNVGQIAKQVSVLKTQVAVLVVSQKIEKAEIQLAELQKQNIPQKSAPPKENAPLAANLAPQQVAYGASPVQQQAVYGASVASAAGNMSDKVFIILAGAGIFLLLGGWSRIFPFFLRRGA